MSICQRGGHSASVVGHYVVIFGGATDRLALNDTWALDIGEYRMRRSRGETSLLWRTETGSRC